jgi:hypothetical protein
MLAVDTGAVSRVLAEAGGGLQAFEEVVGIEPQRRSSSGGEKAPRELGKRAFHRLSSP